MLAFLYDLGAAAIDVAAQTNPVVPGREYLHVDVSRQAFASATTPALASLAYRRQGGVAMREGVFRTTA